MQRIKPVYNEIYHIYNRGVEKRQIFLNDRDYLRFIHDLFEFNNQDPARNLYHHTNSQQSWEVGLPNIKRETRKFFVEILTVCLMPNHFHLMVKQKTDDGVTEFMRKLGAGYTNYFNKKYERVGPLFQGKYKYVHVAKESHFFHLPNYIHLNPLELIMPQWKDEGVKDYTKAMTFLENYRWSSFPDYIGKKNFPSVTQRDFLVEILGSPKNYRTNIEKWLKEINLEGIDHLTLE